MCWGNVRKLHNEKLHNLYSSLNIIRQMKSKRMRWVRYVPCMGEGKPKGKKPLGRQKHRWDQNGHLGDLLGGVDWIPLAQDRDEWWAVVNAVLNLRVRAPQS
jgi:hypothetical protein